MKKVFSYVQGVLNLPDHITDTLAKADKLSICALLYLSKYPNCDAQTLCAKMRVDGVLCSELQLARAIDFWHLNGILRDENESPVTPMRKKVQELPLYESEELAQKLTESDSRIGLLVDDCQHMAKKVFTPTDISRIVALVDYLGFSCDYVRALYTYCVKIEKHNIGYLQKTAQNLYDEGVCTEADLDAYLKAKEESRTLEGRLRTMCGIGARSFTTKEKGFVTAWAAADYALDLLQYAYELTIEATGKISFAYMDKILQTWAQKGIVTVKEAQQAQAEHAAAFAKETAKPQKAQKKTSFQTEDFFQAALKRSYEKSQKKEGDA